MLTYKLLIKLYVLSYVLIQYHPSRGGGVTAGCTVQPLDFIVSLSGYLVYVYKLRGGRDTCTNVASNINYQFFSLKFQRVLYSFRKWCHIVFTPDLAASTDQLLY
jgi:hypothetical protein